MTIEDNKPSSTTEEEYKPFPDPLMGTGEDVTPNLDGGVLKAVRREGDTSEEDRPMKGDKVFVHYVGTLTDGTLFDSSRSRNERFSFTLGQGQVIKAWDLGVATMRRGEIAVFTCKPEYAYGKKGQGKIPPNSTLVFEVELFDWKGEDLTDDHDEGVIRRILNPGEGYENPNDEASVEIHLVGQYQGKEFENRDVSFVITEGSDHGVVDGVELALKKMKKGETARLKLKPKYAYGSEGKAEYNIPADAEVSFEVTLKDFKKAKEAWEMDVEEKLQQSEIIKAKGTDYFKQGKYKDAIKHWKKIINYLETETSAAGEEKEKSEAMQLAANLNVAMAAIKMEDFVEARNHCNRALELDASNVKGHFRRGQALFGMSEFELAKQDFQKVLDLEPSNKAAKNQLTLSNHKLKQHHQKEKRIYGNMFQRFAEQDLRAKLARERALGDIEVGVFDENGKKSLAEGSGGDEETNEGEEAKMEEGGGEEALLGNTQQESETMEA
ncbi:peptidyl-prolyl cis-trans isomerase FKBP4-like [Diadema antillarum]|uniref:peptidyl-prolyl cis-trans isomerase FKBP4-like n=1 Tax=Diadema antillarum TaxID=105358 RepID=UPI003A8B9046